MEKGASFEPVKIADDIFWVGAIDWKIRDFHGYTLRRGTTYNAYLVMGSDPILVDTVKAPFKDELLERVSKVVNPKDIRYIISNHSEMDHSGSLPQVVGEIQPEKVFASAMGLKALSKHFGMDGEITAVGDGESIELGGINFTFLETRMLHWPDSMITYIPSKKFLFSQDGFGLHLASSERFADEIPEGIILEEAGRYFANILLPYSKIVKKLLSRVGELGLDIETIAPDHGPIWREDVSGIINLYAMWAEQKPTKKALIVYDTMWGSTEKMARAIEAGLGEAGAKPILIPIRASHRSDIVAELLDAGALVVGTPTLNNGMFPTISDVLTYMKGLKPQNLVGGAFGSYGWSGEGAIEVGKILSSMGVEMADEPLRVKYIPDSGDIESARELGRKIGERLEVSINGS